MADKIPTIKLLNENQKKEANDLLKFYKYIYQYNHCGSVYGADNKEIGKICPVCELNLKQKKK